MERASGGPLTRELNADEGVGESRYTPSHYSFLPYTTRTKDLEGLSKTDDTSNLKSNIPRRQSSG
jgi:hypothetical protein